MVPVDGLWASDESLPPAFQAPIMECYCRGAVTPKATSIPRSSAPGASRVQTEGQVAKESAKNDCAATAYGPISAAGSMNDQGASGEYQH
jgi:hypothetical protein